MRYLLRLLGAKASGEAFHWVIVWDDCSLVWLPSREYGTSFSRKKIFERQEKKRFVILGSFGQHLANGKCVSFSTVATMHKDWLREQEHCELSHWRAAYAV